MIQQFPTVYPPREVQRDIIARIEECVKSGYKRIILCAPTGVGKSFIGGTVAKHLGSSFIITASKHLQDQYTQDMKFLKPVKGKSNFACFKIMEDKHIDDTIYATKEGMTCEKGQCIEKKVVNNEEKTIPCKFKPTIKEVQDAEDDSNMCLYYLQKYAGLVQPHSVWNYASFFQIMKFNYKQFEEYLSKRVSIFDEAHKIEDQIVQFIGYEIRQRYIEEAALDLNRYNLDDIDDILSIISEIAKHYSERMHEIESYGGQQTHPDARIMSRLTDIYEKAAQARADISEDKENFIANEPVRDQNGSIKSISIKPVDISGFVDEFFNTEYQLFMSATIDKPNFCENIGIDPNTVAIVDTPRSPFPIQNRSINMRNVRYLNYRSTREDEQAVIDEIDRIMDEYSGMRGLILTSSISRCYGILNGLSAVNSRRVRICHSTNNSNGKTQDEILKEHTDDPTGVLLSSSLWEGVDLKDDLSRFQVIAKVPYPNFTERRTKAKMNKFPRWYEAQTLTKLLQGFGRSIRNENDWAKTYVLDAAAGRLFRDKRAIPQSFYDVLGL